MDSKQKQELFEVFGEAFREVVVPELQEIRTNIKELKDKVERIDRKLDKHEDRMDCHGKQLESHEEEIIKLKKDSQTIH